MPAVALVANHQSGSGDADQIDQLIAAAGGEVVERVDVGDVGEARFNADLVVAAGGDGTIAPVARRCGKRGVPLAVVPVGTANDFASRLELPTDPGAAVELALTSTERRPLDLAFVGGRPFVNVASVGLAHEAARRAEDLKNKLGSLAYTAGAMQAGATAEPIDCVVLCDGEQLFNGPAWQVLIACTGAFGGGSEIETKLDDGKLDVVVLEHGPRPQLAKFAFGLRTGSIGSQKGVRDARCRKVTVDALDVEEVNVDGELVEVDSNRIEFRVEPEAFRLVVG